MPISKKTLKKYVLSHIFIETGTLTGTTVQYALDVGFRRIYSVELSEKWAAFSQNKFSNNKRVTIIQGDTSVILPRILKRVKRPSVVWLDAHYSGGETALGPKPCPINDELDALVDANIKEHTILIDDMRGFRESPDKSKSGLVTDLVNPNFNDKDVISLDGILWRLSKINPKYKISYEDGTLADGDSLEKDILIAKI